MRAHCRKPSWQQRDTWALTLEIRGILALGRNNESDQKRNNYFTIGVRYDVALYEDLEDVRELTYRNTCLLYTSDAADE